MATRLKIEAVFSVSDNPVDQRMLADAIFLLLHDFRAPDKSVNRKPPHYDSLELLVERKSWEAIGKDTGAVNGNRTGKERKCVI